MESFVPIPEVMLLENPQGQLALINSFVGKSHSENLSLTATQTLSQPKVPTLNIIGGVGIIKAHDLTSHGYYDFLEPLALEGIPKYGPKIFYKCDVLDNKCPSHPTLGLLFGLEKKLIKSEAEIMTLGLQESTFDPRN